MNKIPSSNINIFSVNNKYLNTTLETLEPPPDPNNATLLGINNDDEIIRASNYKFNLNVEALVSNRNKKKPPRRQNAWILYRKDKSANPEFKGLKSSEISKRVSTMWEKEPIETKALFEVLSRMAVKKHKEIYGEDYKYAPNKQQKYIRKKEKRLFSILKFKNSSPELEMDAIFATSPATFPTIAEQFPSPKQFLPMTMDIENQTFPTPATSSLACDLFII